MRYEESASRSSALVRTEGMYMGVFDRQSRENAPQRFEQMMEEARRLAGDDSWSTIPHLNALLAGLARTGDLLSWVLVFDGVFRVDMEVSNGSAGSLAPLPAAGEFVADVGSEAFLSCPSGEIVVESLHRLGDPTIRPLVQVAAGRYRVRLTGDEAEQARHQFLDSPSSYPQGEGPDWTLSLDRV